MINLWYYKDNPYDPDEKELNSLVGFVYCIEEVSTGMKYIGKKGFWRSKILPVTKKRLRRKRTLVESDWRTYHGSSERLKEQVKSGEHIYKRSILRLCTTKGEMSYYEAREQFDKDVLLRDDYYNQFIGAKIHAKHLPKHMLKT